MKYRIFKPGFHVGKILDDRGNRYFLTVQDIPNLRQVDVWDKSGNGISVSMSVADKSRISAMRSRKIFAKYRLHVKTRF